MGYNLGVFRARAKTDRLLFATILALVVGGFVIFLSAAMGLVARTGGASFESVVLKQTLLGLLPGLVFMYFISRIHYRVWRKIALPLLGGSILLTLLVFFPVIGFGHGGARRWITLGFLTIQPSEFLKLAVAIYLSAWYSRTKIDVSSFRSGAMPFLVLILICGALLVKQPDIDTLLVIFASSVSIYYVAGAKIRHIVVLALLSVAVLSAVVFTFPYFRARINTYLHPSSDSLGSGYQVEQSLIAIGSGGVFGRGFGQSVQKFNYLPEAIGDSIFAVAGEEFGFLGSAALVLFFLVLLSRGFVIAARTSDNFARLLCVGILIMIVTQSFINIGAMLNILPLSGIPLVFVSQGGTALFVTLIEAGILLSISRHAKS